MAKLQWDVTAQKLYETGVEKGVLYPMGADGTYPLGVAWSGLTGVTESPSGAETTPLYADNGLYLNLTSAEKFAATIEALMHPDEFSECNGSAELTAGVSIGQQKRKLFGLAYKTIVGNDTEGDEYGYKLHLIYGCQAAPSEKGYKTNGDNPEALTMSWEVSTTPVAVSGHRPTSYVEIDSTKVDAAKLAKLEDILYGTESLEPRLPLPDEIATLMAGTPAQG